MSDPIPLPDDEHYEWDEDEDFNMLDDDEQEPGNPKNSGLLEPGGSGVRVAGRLFRDAVIRVGLSPDGVEIWCDDDRDPPQWFCMTVEAATIAEWLRRIGWSVTLIV